MRKQTVKRKSVFVVVNDGGISDTFSKFHDAEQQAKLEVETGELNVKILEVVSAWEVDVPHDPEPETTQIELSDLVEDD